MRNLFFENLNHLIELRIFEWLKFDHIFINPYEFQFLFIFQIFCPKNIFFESFRWGIIPLDFVGFLFRTSKPKNDISYIQYKFSHRFGKVCKWLNIYYSKIRIIIFKKVTTISIWINLKNLTWTYKECIFSRYWITVPYIHV